MRRACRRNDEAIGPRIREALRWQPPRPPVRRSGFRCDIRPFHRPRGGPGTALELFGSRASGRCEAPSNASRHALKRAIQPHGNSVLHQKFLMLGNERATAERHHHGLPRSIWRTRFRMASCSVRRNSSSPSVSNISAMAAPERPRCLRPDRRNPSPAPLPGDARSWFCRKP